MAKINFDSVVAKKYGVAGAVFIEYLYGWICLNRTNNRNFHDGRYWTYNTLKEYGEKLDFLSVRQIQVVIEKLENAGAIHSANYNRNRADRTKWYTLSDEILNYFDNIERTTPVVSQDALRVFNIINNLE